LHAQSGNSRPAPLSGDRSHPQARAAENLPVAWPVAYQEGHATDKGLQPDNGLQPLGLVLHLPLLADGSN